MTLQFMQQREPHPAGSPDLATSDFDLFGYVKQFLSGCQFADKHYFLQAVSDILVGIENVTLESAFHNWMERLCQCSATRGKYVESRNF
jgi:hypothetical protein